MNEQPRDLDRSEVPIVSEIRLSFHRDDSRQYPTGYWVAEAGPAPGRVDYDGVGLSPLDAAMALAEQIYASIKRNESRS